MTLQPTSRPPLRAGHDARTAAAEALYGLMVAMVRQTPREVSLTAAATMATLERTGPRRITDLAALEGVTQPSMTALVGTLERSGFVERRRAATDQRVVLVSLTPAGAGYLRAVRRSGAEGFARLIDKLPAEDLGAVARAAPALAAMVDRHDRDREPAP